MMIIALEGMRFRAPVGFYEEEQLLGSDIVIDLHLSIDDSRVTDTENLSETIRYESVYTLLKDILRQKVKLLETIAERIQQKIFAEFSNVDEVHVQIRKLQPPLPGVVHSVRIEKKWRRQ